MKIIKSALINFVTNFIVLFVLAWILPNMSLGFPTGFGNFSWTAFEAALPSLLILVLIMTVAMQVIKPLLKLLFLPVNFFTLGLFNFILDLLLMWLVIYLSPALTLEPLVLMGINFGQWGTLIIFALLFSLGQSVVLSILK